MPLPSNNLADRAAERAARFELGLLSQASIVSWADEVIAELPEPPIELIDLSLSRGSDADALVLLERLPQVRIQSRFAPRCRSSDCK